MFKDVFLVTIDSLRPDYLGAYNPHSKWTPTIDRLTQGATVFTQAVTQAPFTTPAIASLLTGTYPFRHGVRLLLGQLCNESLLTLAEYARMAGFVTGGFPSVFILNSETGLNRGFDHYEDVTDGIETCRGGCWQRGDVINRRIDAFLQQAGPSRVFVWVHYFDLHDYHLDSRVPIQESYPRDLHDKIDQMCIGGLLEVLRRHDRLDQAGIILTADHAESLNQHGERGHGHHLYDSVMRIPLIWRWGDLPRDLSRVDRQVRLVDIMPTLLELWGVHQDIWPSPMDGQSLAPLLKGLSEPADIPLLPTPSSYGEASPRQLFEGDIKAIKTFAGPEQQALRTEDYKFILHADGRQELYDLHRDPDENNNIAERSPAVCHRFAYELAELAGATASRIAMPEYSREDEIEVIRRVIRRLRALGYVN